MQSFLDLKFMFGEKFNLNLLDRNAKKIKLEILACEQILRSL